MLPLSCFMENASKIVSSAILGMDMGTCVINNKPYFIQPPTIRRLAGAGYYLSDGGESIKDMLFMMSSDKLAKALSWMVQGNESLADEFMNAPIEEVIEGLETAYSLIKTENFIRLSVLTKSIERLIAKQKR